MKVRAMRALGYLAVCVGLAAWAPAQAQFGSDETVGLSYGLRGGLIFPLTELDGSAGPSASIYARYGLMRKLQLEVGGGYSRLNTEDNFDVAGQRFNARITDEFGTDMGIVDGRLVFSPFSFEKWNPFIYGGFGGIRYDFDPHTARRGTANATGWFPYIPIGIGTQWVLSERLAIEVSLHYGQAFTNKLDENYYDRLPDPNNPGQFLSGVVNGQVVAGNIQKHDGDDAFWGIMAGVVLGDIGYKPAIQERATVRPRPMPTPEVAVPEILPELEPEPAPKPLPPIPTLERDRVFFASNLNAPLTDESMRILDAAASVMQQDMSLLIELHGYADSTGPRPYNLKLSYKRAQTVKAYLVARGVQAWRINMRAFGEDNPVATNSTAEGRAMNRRVELIPLR